MNIQYGIGFVEVELKELFDFVIGGDWGKDPDFTDESYSLAYCIRGSEFRNWKENKGKTASLRKIKTSSVNTRKLKQGDILVEISGGGPEQPVGRTVIIDKSVLAYKSDIPKISTNFLRLIRITEHIDPNYLNLFLTFFYKSGEIVAYQGGSNNLRNLKFEEYALIKAPIPPLAEQHRIVTKIEELFSSLDKAIERITTAKQQLKVYRQAVLKWAFEGKLTNLTNENVISRVDEVAEVIDPQPSHRTPPEFIDGIPYVSIKDCDYGSNTINFDGARKVHANVLKEHVERYSLKKGDFIIGKIGTIGQPIHIYLPQNYTLSANVVLIQPRGINGKYLYYYFQSNIIQTEFKKGQKATAQAAFGIQKVRALPIRVPLPDEQEKIVLEVESRLSVCDKIEEGIETSLLKAEALRQSILKKAFEGKLVPQDPNDESASKLIERIKTERERNSLVKGKKE